MTSHLVLASASPRRRELAPLLGLPVRVAPQDVPEESFALPDPTLAALNIALAKVRSAVSTVQADEIVLGADSIVVCDGDSLGKPTTAEVALGMLIRLRGRRHTVVTGVALARADGITWSGVVETAVHMRTYADLEMAAYVERGEPFDKAGGYAVQDRLFQLVERLDGCYLNVVGLPLCAAARGLETLGVATDANRDGGEPLIPPCRLCQAGAASVGIG